MSLPTPGQATLAAIGKGLTLSYATATLSSGTYTAGTYTPVGELLDIKMPKHSADTIEIQRYDSPTLYGELIPSWFKAGEVDVSITYNATQGAALFNALGILSFWKVVKNDGNIWTYLGILSEFGDEMPLKDKMMNTVKFKISGAPVTTAGSPPSISSSSATVA